MIFALLAVQLQPRVAPVKLSEPDILGEYYAKPNQPARRPGILLLHGSEGAISFTRFSAEGLAWEGFPSLAIQWFGGKSQPKNLVEVPLETIKRGVDWLVRQPEVDGRRIHLIGVSRGAEAALTYASLDSRITKVVAVSPSAMRFQGFIDYATPCTQAAFSWQAKPLAFSMINFAEAKKPELQYQEALLAKENQASWSKIEDVNGPIMLVSGDQDVVWPSSLLAGAAVERLQSKKFKHKVQWERYPNAGHLLMTPAGSFRKGMAGPTTYGGTKNGVAFALLDVWPKMIKFLGE